MKALYPADWKDIRKATLTRAGDKCEKCGRPNGEVVVVGKNGDWRSLEYYQGWADSNGCPIPCPSGYYDNHEETNPGYHGAKTILTISHQDHDPTNNAPSNLKALCQRCHLTHDAKEHASNARRTRARKAGQCELFETEAAEQRAKTKKAIAEADPLKLEPKSPSK